MTELPFSGSFGTMGSFPLASEAYHALSKGSMCILEPFLIYIIDFIAGNIGKFEKLAHSGIQAWYV